jgi:hypothetical protein
MSSLSGMKRHNYDVYTINIDMSPMNDAKSELDAQHIKLALIWDALYTWQVLQFGYMLTNQVIPVPVEETRYTWYITPEGGAYVWDAWRSTRDSNPNIVMFIRFHANYGKNEGGSGRAAV